MYSLYAGDTKEPDAPSYRGTLPSVKSALDLLGALQRDILYDWWMVRNVMNDEMVAHSDGRF